ncbi:hypothetical protein AB6Q85_002324 [Vibrio cholerae]
MNKETFLSKGIKPRKVHIDSINSEVYIRPMSYSAMIALSKCTETQERTLVTALFGLVDESGKALFSEEDKELLGFSMSFDTIREVADEVVKATTLTDNDLVK